MKYFYKVYGLNIESNIKILELHRISENNKKNVDLNLSYGIVSKDIKRDIENGIDYKYNKQDMWFHIKGVAIYHIYNSDTVIVEPCKDADFKIIKVYILGSALGLVLLQKNIVAIHGGAILIDNKGCVFTGDKGAGKSTITTALRKKGYKFISDDVASIKIGEFNMINPGFGYQKLCEDAMTKLGYDVNKFEPFRSDTNIKYIVPALDSFVDKEVPLNALFELNVGDVESVCIEEIVGADKINKFMKNIFRIEMMYYSGGVNSIYFKKCIDIIKNIKFYKITRPRAVFSVEEQIRVIEGII